MAKNYLTVLCVCSSLFLANCAARSISPKEFVAQMRANDYFTEPRQAQLAKAISDDDVNAVKALIARGADVNYRGRENMTPLFWALGKKSKKVLPCLLDKGANPNFRISAGGQMGTDVSPVYFAAIMEDPEFLQLIVRYGGDPNMSMGPGRSNQTVLFDTISHQRRENLCTLIAVGADVNCRDAAGTTPIISAAQARLFSFAYILLKHGADPLIRDRFGYDLPDIIRKFGDRGASSTERAWFKKIVTELDRRKLL